MKSKYFIRSILVMIIFLMSSFSSGIYEELKNPETARTMIDDDSLNCTFICNLIDERANKVGIKGTDLGVGFERNDEICSEMGRK